MIKKIFYDLETTGLDPVINGVHQLSGCIEIDGNVAEYFNFKMKPFPTDEVEQKALDVGGVTIENLASYPEPQEVYKKFLTLMGKYVNKFDKKDKFFLYGYNNRKFDDNFLRSWFDKMGDKYFGSWFCQWTSDIMVLAVEHLLEDILEMENFKLMTVAKHMGIEIDETKAHDAVYDIDITRQLYFLIMKSNKTVVPPNDDLPF
jgi:DNA polymerase III subunit epsilon